MKKKVKKVFEGMLAYKEEDSGQALVGELELLSGIPFDEKEQMFVRVQSWDENLVHTDARKYENKRVRVTVEIVED